LLEEQKRRLSLLALLEEQKRRPHGVRRHCPCGIGSHTEYTLVLDTAKLRANTRLNVFEAAGVGPPAVMSASRVRYGCCGAPHVMTDVTSRRCRPSGIPSRDVKLQRSG
jgi:hypothetical protein